MRIKDPTADRPYRVPLYPLPPLLVNVMAVIIIISSLLHDWKYPLMAFSFVMLSLPTHMILYENRNNTISVEGGSISGIIISGDTESALSPLSIERQAGF